MSTRRDSLPEPLRAQIEAAALSFASQIVGAFEKSIGDVTTRLAAQSSTAPSRSPRSTAKVAPKRAAKPAPKAAPTAIKQGRAFDRRIESALKKSDGMGAEQLNRALGSTTSDLAPALQRLMDQGRVGKRGKARGTKYFLV